MTYPNEFYYQQTLSTMSYSDSPTGELDVGRLIEGQPCWINSSSPEVPKPKKLILSDWSALSWSEEKQEEVKDALGTLLDEHFELYLWQNGRVIPLLREDIWSLTKEKVRQAISLASTAEVLEAAVQQHSNLTRDTIQVLDDYWLRRALGYSMGSCHGRVIFMNDLVHSYNINKSSQHLDEAAYYKKVLDILRKSIPRPRHIVPDEYPFYQSVATRGFISELATYREIIPDFICNKLKLNEKAYRLFQMYLKEGGGGALLVDLIETAEEISFVFPISREILVDILEHRWEYSAISLKKLHFSQNSLFTDKSIELIFPLLSTLKILHLESSKLNFDVLENYLRSNSNLRTLKLDGCTLSNKCELAANSLPHIRFFNLVGTDINPECLNNFLEATPNLKKLAIWPFVDFSALVDSNKGVSGRFEQLESLNLSMNEMSCSTLEFFIKDAKNLKYLNLSGCSGDFLEGDLTQLKGLQFLEELSLSYCKLDFDSIKALLKGTKNVKLVKLGNRLDLKGKIEEFLPLGATADFQDSKVEILRKAPTQVPADPIHNPLKMKEFKPISKNKPFEFNGNNKTLNQGMIIEKFCHYLSLKKEYVAIIPALQDGICNALTHYFVEKPDELQQLIREVSAWSGECLPRKGALPELFESLHQYVIKYQLNSGSKPLQFLGENLTLFLKSSSLGISYILKNPWHAIALRPLDGGSWEVYDPNFVAGPRTVSDTKLMSTLDKVLGTLISVESDKPLEPRVGDALAFIEQGGLLALCQDANASKMMKDLLPIVVYTKVALDGILFRDVDGIPAWVNALRQPELSFYLFALLDQFIATNPENYMHQLQKSIEYLSAQRRGQCIENLIQQFSVSKSELGQKLVEVFRMAPISSEEYEGLLQTWSSTTLTFDSVLKYCQYSLEYNDKTKRLIQLPSTKELDALQYALQDTAQKMNRPVFYINSPKDLVCLRAYITRTGDDRGLLTAGPGGPLYDFLKANTSKRPILIVNYEQFNSEEIVRSNSLLDAEARADGTILPKDTLVIGLINTNKPNCYQGADFYSRFDRRETCPLSKELLLDQLPALPVNEFIPAVSINPALPVIPAQAGIHPQDGSVATAEMGSRLRGKDSLVINLYNAPDWKERLIGRWTLKDRNLVFQKGALEEALAKKGPIEIQNAPWDEPEFQQFWRQALLTGQVDYGRIVIPSDLQLIHSTGYDWDELKSFVTFEPGISQEAVVLNPNRLGEFFNRYVCEQNSLIDKDGFLQAASGKPLHVTLTRALSKDSWARLLKACKEHTVHLVAHYAAGIELPKDLGSCLEIEPTALKKTAVILSKDTDTTVAQYTTKQSWTVIDVSECKPSDIMRRIDGGLVEGDSPYFRFEEFPSVLIELLKANKNIILKGHFSPELADELAPLLLSRELESEPSGALVLVTEDPCSFNFVSQEKHLVLKSEELFSDTAWSILERLSGGIPDLGVLDVSTSKEESKQFTEERLKRVRKLLDKDHYVFLGGLSGVGKSTFVTQDLCEEGDRLYTGDKNIEAWAKDTKTTGRTLLFLDEANLSSRKWSEFEGLFQNPPTILIRGVLHTLTPSHQVIFAGNPLSYGDERTLAPFFKRHGNIVVFSPLPPALLYEKSLKPVFEGSSLEAQAEEICKQILKMYAYLCQCSKRDVLISPRELQMIALLVKAGHQRDSTLDPIALTKHYAYQLGVQLLMPSYRDDFEREFKPYSCISRRKTPKLKEFLITPSREHIQQQLDDCLTLRELRQKGNDIQKYGGLGGLVLEGPPGVGKSELVLASLLARGFKEQDLKKEQFGDEPIFYLMPVSLSLKEKEVLLRKAFDEGAVVVIDEINSSPMMERLLNDLLMGKTPENQRPKRPGFMVIGTQNPVSMAGRRAPSTALARRLIKAELPDYPVEEIQTILEAKGLPANKAFALAEAFKKQVDYARLHHLSPAPSFRDLLRVAKEEMKGRDCTTAWWAGSALPTLSPPYVYGDLNHECMLLLEASRTTKFCQQDNKMDRFFKAKQQELENAKKYDPSLIMSYHLSLI